MDNVVLEQNLDKILILDKYTQKLLKPKKAGNVINYMQH